MIIPRWYDNLKAYLKLNKVLVLFGPRRVGKTTLINQYLKTAKFKYKYASGDDLTVQNIFSSQNVKKIKEYCAGYRMIVIDEAQRIPKVGYGLKIIVDYVEKIYVVATGSSSFDLSGQIGEPLTGRKKTLILYPLSQLELGKIDNRFELKEKLEDFLIFGGYPEIITAKSSSEKKEVLFEIVNSYLLKDILELEKVKGAKILLDLLRLLAFQIGSEVSLNELSNNLKIDVKTVARYLDLFEKSFILYNLRGFSRNLRTEVTKKSKYYFYDNGIRNAIISNFNGLELRDDVGKLWENFLVIERLKYQKYKKIYVNNYFWRSWSQKEIDWIEERGGNIFGYEFKFTKRKLRPPREFVQAYPSAKIQLVHKENYLSFVA